MMAEPSRVKGNKALLTFRVVLIAKGGVNRKTHPTSICKNSYVYEENLNV
jgi:hypothetical protein